MRIDDRVFQTSSGRKVEVVVFSSNYHVELNPSDAGIYDRVVVQDIIKDIAQSQQVDKLKGPFKGMRGIRGHRRNHRGLLVAVITDADKLTRDAQQALRRTMEKFSSNIRLILCCSSSSRIMDPIKSRCLQVRVPAPSDPQVLWCHRPHSLRLQITSALLCVCKDENIHLEARRLESIVQRSEGNVRKALLCVELCANQ